MRGERRGERGERRGERREERREEPRDKSFVGAHATYETLHEKTSFSTSTLKK